jgi:hypothetical protein
MMNRKAIIEERSFMLPSGLEGFLVKALSPQVDVSAIEEGLDAKP